MQQQKYSIVGLYTDCAMALTLTDRLVNRLCAEQVVVPSSYLYWEVQKLWTLVFRCFSLLLHCDGQDPEVATYFQKFCLIFGSAILKVR